MIQIREHGILMNDDHIEEDKGEEGKGNGHGVRLCSLFLRLEMV